MHHVGVGLAYAGGVEVAGSRYARSLLPRDLGSKGISYPIRELSWHPATKLKHQIAYTERPNFATSKGSRLRSPIAIPQ